MPEGGRKKTKKTIEGNEEKQRRVNLKVKVRQQEKKEIAADRSEKHEEKKGSDQFDLVSPTAEKEKTIMMWGGVIFFMAIIIIFWAFSFKNVMNSRSTTAEEDSSAWEKVNKIGEEIDKNIDVAKEQVDKMKFRLELEARLQASSTELVATSSDESADASSSNAFQLSAEEVKNISEELQKIKK